MIEKLLAKAISDYTNANDTLRVQMKGKAIVPTWEGLPLPHKLIVLDSVITPTTPCFGQFNPRKIEYYIGKENEDA